MPLPIVKYPPNITFGARLLIEQAAREAVAARVVDEYLRPGSSAFISDGSSTIYIATELYSRGHNIHIDTNSIPIAHEYPFWYARHLDENGRGLPNIKVRLVKGDVDHDLIMVHGENTHEDIVRSVLQMEYVVLSANAVYFKHGPVGEEHNSLRIKQIAKDKATQSRVIWVIDHTKLYKWQKDPPANLVYRPGTEWENAMNDDNRGTTIVTSRDPQATLQMLDAQQNLNTAPRTDMDKYLWNRWFLKSRMGKRFVEV